MTESPESQQLVDVFDESHPLSNCYPAQVVFEGVTFPSAEHAYQAMKFFDEDMAGRGYDGWSENQDILDAICVAETGPEAKDVARGFVDRAFMRDRQQKVAIITAVMRARFLQNDELRATLLGTGERTIYEEYPFSVGGGEDFWGVRGFDGEKYVAGDNVIGNILMQLRDEFLRE